MKVAYQGEPGAYSERAVQATFPDADPLPCDTVRLVFSRVTSGEAPFGVVPMENSQAGSVNETYDLLQHTSLLRIVGEVVVRVDHALLGVPGARLEDNRRAKSHWQALAQCEEFLASMRIEPVPVHDTAGAARQVAAAADRAEGAIASVAAAENFDLKVLGEPDKTSLVWAVLDEPGSLLGSLEPFAKRGINLHKLESRPRRGKPFEYLMYVDVMAGMDDQALGDALHEVERHTSMVRVLGT